MVATPFIGTALLWSMVAGVSAAVVPEPGPVEPPAQVDRVSTIPAVENRLIPESESTPQRIRTCTIDQELLDFGSSSLGAMVSLSSTGEELWATDQEALHPPASVAKLLTVLAAWRVLGPDHRLSTSVVAGAPGEVWLVGGGDATLTRSPGNNYYDSNSSLGELASQTIQALTEKGDSPITTVYTDDSRYRPFPSWDNSWRANATSLGYVAPITALQVDGDRDAPAVRLSPRSMDPSSRAGEWFADALVTAGNTARPQVASAPRSASGDVLATVSSAPLRDLITAVLQDSDNTLAEVLAREVALAQGTTDLQKALIEGSEIESSIFSGMVIQDGSGLSPLNQASAEQVLAVLREISSDPELQHLIDQLPIAGETGSLRNRFASAGKGAAGVVQAKTGSIQGVRSLAGVIPTESDILLFSVNVSGPRVSDATRDNIDRLVEAFYLCGENLAHWSEQVEKAENVG